jgi:hypothetical protein
MTSLKEVKSYALGDDDLQKILPNSHIFTYPYLRQVKDIDEIFDDKGRALMLYLTEDHRTGHWVALSRYPDHIEFFDPYGQRPDTELNWIGKGKRMELDVDKPLLRNLLKAKGLPVVYSKHQFQKDGDDIATCGRHSAVRLLYKHLSLPQYRKMIQDTGLPPDEFVSRITFPLIKK